jgi:hypothetical protein
VFPVLALSMVVTVKSPDAPRPKGTYTFDVTAPAA